MADCTFLEQSFSHFIPELAGSMISTLLIAVSLFSYDWRMALATLWVMPVSFCHRRFFGQGAGEVQPEGHGRENGMCRRNPGSA